MEILASVIRIGLVVATAAIFEIILLTCLRLRNRKMILMTVGFGIFFIHALISIPELFNETYAIALDEDTHLFFDFIGLLFILLGILKD